MVDEGNCDREDGGTDAAGEVAGCGGTGRTVTVGRRGRLSGAAVDEGGGGEDEVEANREGVADRNCGNRDGVVGCSASLCCSCFTLTLRSPTDDMV